MVQSTTRHPLFTNQLGLLVTAERRVESEERPHSSHSADNTNTLRGRNTADTRSRAPQQSPAAEPRSRMPCRKENYIFLEQSVTVDSKEVDALVTKIGEALQLHNNNSVGIHQKTVSVSVSCLHGLTGSGSAGGVKPAALFSGGAAAEKRRGSCCMRLRGHRGSSRASPYHIPGSSGQEWDQIRPWTKKRRTEEDDPHRMLQDLILSGNLIKEAVRRLQFSGDDCGDFPQAAADNVPTHTR